LSIFDTILGYEKESGIMARKQTKWEYNDEGILSCELPEGAKCEFDLTELFVNWTDFDEVERFYAAYGVKQKLSDRCAATKDASYTEEEKVTRMKELFIYTVEKRKLPKSEKSGIARKVTPEKIAGAVKTFTPEQIAELQKQLDERRAEMERLGVA
jgi:hypothetical protein